jgi:hypothetical protein
MLTVWLLVLLTRAAAERVFLDQEPHVQVRSMVSNIAQYVIHI